jgi:hypothetical protein
LYIPASVSLEKLQGLMSESLTSFTSLFRAVLLLKGLNPPVTKHEIVRLTAKELMIDLTPLTRIFEIRERDVKPMNETEAHEVFASYMAQIERVIEFVDKLKHET